MDNIFQQNTLVSREERNNLNHHSSFLIFFTGLSGSGKSTIASGVEKMLHDKKISTYLLDGDNVRLGLNKNLGFSAEDRIENLRRIGEVSKLFVDAGIVTLAAFVSPYLSERQNIKDIVGHKNFIEVYINTSIEECERRDVKGLYLKARKGEISNFTGISAPYEAPINPDIEINTEHLSIEESVAHIYNQIKEKIAIKA